MDKRSRLLIVIIVGLILLLLGLWVFLTPLLQKEAPAQPPAINGAPAAPDTFVPPVREAPVVPTQPDAKPTAGSGKLALENQARAYAERMGTGTSGNGFIGYNDVMINATANGRTALLAAQADMRKQHPATGPAYGATAKAATANTIQGTYGDAQLVILMDVLISEDAGQPDKPTGQVNRQMEMRFTKQTDGTYLIEGFTWK